jgi:4-hydroxybenzoate polyprenyltransferase
MVDFMKNIIKLIRVRQWYKNFLVFLPLIFSQNLFNLNYLMASIFGFFALSFISSTNYVINDIFDRKKDAKNPEKKNRPIASGKIKLWQAIVIALVLFGASIFISLNLSYVFLFFVFSLFLTTQIYTFILKNIAFADILTISVNFVLRTVSGVFIVSNTPKTIGMSYWLILCPFFLALFLASSKRQSEIKFLKSKAKKHRRVLAQYTKEVTFGLMIISTTLLIAAYSIYVITGPYKRLIFTLPFVLYIVFKLFYFADKGMQVARKLDMVFKNKDIVLCIIIILIITFFAIYANEIWPF